MEVNLTVFIFVRIFLRLLKKRAILQKLLSYKSYTLKEALAY